MEVEQTSKFDFDRERLIIEQALLNRVTRNMRMWMIDPELMCVQHILGEHRELHALLGSLERTKPKYENSEKHRKNLATLAKFGLIELKSLKERHDKLAGYLENHKTPIEKVPTLKYLPDEVARAEVDKEKAKRDLINRPSSCRPEGYCRRKLSSNR